MDSNDIPFVEEATRCLLNTYVQEEQKKVVINMINTHVERFYGLLPNQQILSKIKKLLWKLAENSALGEKEIPFFLYHFDSVYESKRPPNTDDYYASDSRSVPTNFGRPPSTGNMPPAMYYPPPYGQPMQPMFHPPIAFFPPQGYWSFPQDYAGFSSYGGSMSHYGAEQ